MENFQKMNLENSQITKDFYERMEKQKEDYSKLYEEEKQKRIERENQQK